MTASSSPTAPGGCCSPMPPTGCSPMPSGWRRCARSSASSSATPTCRRRSTACARRRRKAGGCRRRCGSPGRAASRRGGCGCGCGRSATRTRPATAVWTVADVTRDRERQENVFQELQHAIDYLDHAPAGFFSVDGHGDIVYLNATLAGWLDYDLAQVGSGGLRLSDILPGDSAALLDHAVRPSRRGQDRGARPRPAPPRRPYPAGAPPSQGRVRVRRHARRVAHPRPQPRRRRRQRSAAHRGSALHALLPQHADGDRHGRPQRPHRPHQRAVRPSRPERAQGRAGGGAGPLHPRRRRRRATAP